jgi:hypothetical protein
LEEPHTLLGLHDVEGEATDNGEGEEEQHGLARQVKTCATHGVQIAAEFRPGF